MLQWATAAVKQYAGSLDCLTLAFTRQQPYNENPRLPVCPGRVTEKFRRQEMSMSAVKRRIVGGRHLCNLHRPAHHARGHERLMGC